MDRAQMRSVKQHIMAWGSGVHPPAARPAGATATILLADRGHLAAVLESGLTGPGTVVLAPGEHDEERGVVGYQGSATEPGADLSVGSDFYLQTQDYVSSAFMSVLGPTLIRVTDQADFAAFVADVDRARTEGVFPDFAIAPSVLLADVPALGGERGTDGPGLRLYVDEDGAISTGPNGSPIGTVGDPMTTLVNAWQQVNDASRLPCGVCLGAVVPETERTAALLERPFVGRYLAAVEALRKLTLNEIGQVRVSGFGGRLTPGLPDIDSTGSTGSTDDTAGDLLDPSAPLVMWNPEQAYVIGPDGRVFAVDRTVAAAVECIGAAGQAAGEFLPQARLDQVSSRFAAQGLALSPRIPAGAR